MYESADIIGNSFKRTYTIIPFNCVPTYVETVLQVLNYKISPLLCNSYIANIPCKFTNDYYYSTIIQIVQIDICLPIKAFQFEMRVKLHFQHFSIPNRKK